MTWQLLLMKLLKHGDYVLSQTPEMLPVLKQAGVVDSGGQGLMAVLKGAYDAFLGKEVDYTLDEASAPSGINNRRYTYEMRQISSLDIVQSLSLILDKPMSDETRKVLQGIFRVDW